jgi:hypothetical protein
MCSSRLAARVSPLEPGLAVVGEMLAGHTEKIELSI